MKKKAVKEDKTNAEMHKAIAELRDAVSDVQRQFFWLREMYQRELIDDEWYGNNPQECEAPIEMTPIAKKVWRTVRIEQLDDIARHRESLLKLEAHFDNYIKATGFEGKTYEFYRKYAKKESA